MLDITSQKVAFYQEANMPQVHMYNFVFFLIFALHVRSRLCFKLGFTNTWKLNAVNKQISIQYNLYLTIQDWPLTLKQKQNKTKVGICIFHIQWFKLTTANQYLTLMPCIDQIFTQSWYDYHSKWFFSTFFLQILLCWGCLAGLDKGEELLKELLGC